MENIGIGAGLGAIAFWGFVAIVVVAYYWDNIRKREAQHETVRRMMESDKPVDPAIMDKVLSLSGSENENLGRDLKVSGLIVIFLAPGLAVLGWFLSLLAEEALYPLLGVALLMVFLGVGLLVAAKAAREPDRDNSAPTVIQPPGAH